MSEIVNLVSSRKSERARLGGHVTKFVTFISLGLVSFVFKGSYDSNWIFVCGFVTAFFVIFSVFELLEILKVFLAKPIQLNAKQSALLNAKGIGFEVKTSKPKPQTTPSRDLDTSLSACLLNRSTESPKNVPLKKSNPQSPNIRNRRSHSIHNQSITEENELDEYLYSFNGSDSSEMLLSYNQPRKPWTAPIQRVQDQLSRYQYQLSRSPPKNRATDQAADFDNGIKGGNAFEKMNISNEVQSRWAINLRKYIWGTIIRPLVKKIDRVNDQLKASLPDVQIGKASLTDLKAISNMTLQKEIIVLLPYLETTKNHAYFIQRLKTLAKGGYLSEYVWDGGESFQGKQWSANDNPTDSKIMIDLISCWLDTHLPPDPSAGPDARAFSERYVMKKTDGDKKLSLKELPTRVPFALVEKSNNPPEYYVQSRTEIKELPQGRSNPLGAVLLLFYMLNRENYGEISGVSLGRAGINILSVYD